MNLSIFLLTALFVLLPFQAISAPSPVFHDSIPGSWQVKSVYKLFNGNDHWSSPVIWNFTLSKNEKSDLYKGYLLKIEEEITTLNVALEVNLDASFSVKRVVLITSNRQGSNKREEVFPETRPYFSKGHPVPFELPVFPLDIEQQQTFTFFEKVGSDLRKQITINQESLLVKSIPGQDVLQAENGFIRVQCRTSDGRNYFVQYRDHDHFWPIYGENNRMRYWLVIP